MTFHIDTNDLQGSVIGILLVLVTSVDWVTVEVHTEALLKILVLMVSLVLGIRALVSKNKKDENNFGELEDND